MSFNSNLFLPLEIVREIVEFAYALAEPPPIPRFENLNGLGISTKPPWQALAPLSVSSRTYREIVLEVWFRSLNVRSANDLEEGSDMFLTGLCQWTRFIHCLGLKHSDKEINLEALKKLQILRLDENLVGRDLNSTTAGLINTFVNPPAHLSEVHVNGIAQPNPSVISALQRFSDLRILRLRQTRTWCDLCNLGCLLALAAPLPKSIVYENGAGLSIHYMKALSSLERLEFVSITVNVFEDSEVRLGDSEDWNPFAWSGECDDCMHTVLASPEFRTHWVALKTGQEQEIEGFGGRKYRFHKIPNLKRVEWHFADGEVVDVDSDYEEEDEEDEEGLDEISPEL